MMDKTQITLPSYTVAAGENIESPQYCQMHILRRSMADITREQKP